MREFSHWNLRYARDRLGELLYQRLEPEAPWLTKRANAFLDSYLREADAGLEWGSGRSTIWFARRVRRLISVEHDPVWHKKILKRLHTEGLDNVTYVLHSKVPSIAGSCAELDTEYVGVAKAVEPSSLDFVLVDGVHRAGCALTALSRIKPGGVLVVDNINHYLPSDSRSPNSRTHGEGPAGSVWAEFATRVADWRVIWTTSGVTDTAIWIRPCLGGDCVS